MAGDLEVLDPLRGRDADRAVVQTIGAHVTPQANKLQFQSESVQMPDFAELFEVRRQAEALESPLGVVLGADSLAARRSGIGRVTLEISRGLRRHAEIRDFCFLLRGRLYPAASLWPELPDDGDPAPVGDQSSSRTSTGRKLRAQLARIPTARKLHEMKLKLELQREVQRLRQRVDGRVVYHEPNFIARPFDGITVVTVNDFSWRHLASYHPRERIEWIDKNLARTVKQTSRFIAVSEFTAKATMEELGVDRSRIDVVPWAPSAVFRPMNFDAAAPILAKYDLQDGGYILSVSTLEPRKNFDRLLLAHSKLPQSLRERYPLVISGGVGWGQVLDSPLAERSLREGHLKLLGHVPDCDLVALMARSGAFAYVSLYEGFGLPVIEAMASGAPVIASRTTAVGETAGSAALLVDPLDEADIAQAMRRILEDRAASRLFAELGLARARSFTWERTIDGLVASWREAVASP
ncbi:MAG TPA: glycosyltransferase family 1 protein [Alphaproteobacteria bacterium]|nr:glycosyltransferase family 1 protein [Alphaproteobacteria bacterium]